MIFNFNLTNSNGLIILQRIAQNALKYEDTNAIVVNWENGMNRIFFVT